MQSGQIDPAGRLMKDATLVLVRAGNGWQLFISKLSVSVDPCEILWAETALALPPFCGDLYAKELLKSFLLMWLFKKLTLS